MTEPTEQHPVIGYTLDLVRRVQLFGARETLLELAKEILMVKDLAKLEKQFPGDADHFFDNFTDVPSHPSVKILSCDFHDCDRDLPWGKVPAATAVYGASTDNEAEIEAQACGDDGDGDDNDDDEDYDPEEATYVETGCWLLNPSLALIASVRMGPHNDEDHDASGELEIIHSWDRRALRAFLETRIADYPDQVTEAKVALDNVLGAASANPEASRAPGALRP